MNTGKALADWLAYLESLHPKTIALGLDRIEQVRQALGLNPVFPIITVGGTNGKGSVCAMLESILYAAGYKVGCYTSPHLLHYNERVRIAKQQANDAELCAAFEKVEQARGDVSLTYFEFGTLAAMQLFIERQVEVAILEVGLGGRLDAVNIFGNDCSVVTSVDMDHMDYLGDTREQIAVEKAGIFRSGKVAIFGDPEMPEAIASEARRIGADLWRLGIEFSWNAHPFVSVASGKDEKAEDGVQWDYRGLGGNRNALPFPALQGTYQLNNASSALAALAVVKDSLPVSMEAVRRGLLETELPGRFQVVPGRPQLILDVAHNPAAALALARNLAAMPPCSHTWAVFAMLKDKDVAGVASILATNIDTWLIAGIDAPRGATADELEKTMHDNGIRGEILSFENVAAAMAYACNAAGENDRIAAFGSFYTVAEAMQVKGLGVTGYLA